MNIYINKIRDILVDLMPKHWYKIYLYFECSELGSTSGCYYIKTPGGSIIQYGEFIYNFSDENSERIKQGMYDILTNVDYYTKHRLRSGLGEQCIFHAMIMSPIVNFIMI